MDWVTLYLRHFFVDAFRQQGASIVNMSHGSEAMQLVGNEPVYSDSLTITTYSEFQRTTYPGIFGTIDAVCIVNVNTLLANGAIATRISS